MSAEILKFTGITVIPEPANDVLEKAKAWDLDRVVIVGSTKKGEFIFGGSHSEIPEAILLLEIGKKRLLEASDG